MGEMATIFWLGMLGFAMTIGGAALVNSDERGWVGPVFIAIGGTLILLALMLLISAASALDGDHHGNQGDLKAWFNSLQSDKGACCSFADGYTLQDADWESIDGHYRVRVPLTDPRVGPSDLIWIEVPDDAVVTVPNLFQHTVVWPLYNKITHSHPIIRCFMPGTMT